MRLLHIFIYVLVSAAVSYIAANASANALIGGGALAERISAPRITEDDPRWNCKTMGNGVCGPNVENDPRFQEYDRLFNCFAEVAYTEPRLSWDDQVMRCIPPVSSN